VLLISGCVGFILGVGFVLFFFSEEIYHGQKVGYNEDDINPDSGCCRSVPSAQFKPVRPKE
jgi:hypothetical protein